MVAKMDKKPINVPNFIGGKAYENSRTRAIFSYDKKHLLNVSIADHYQIEGAINRASATQPKLESISVSEIAEVLKYTIDDFFRYKKNIDIGVKITGSSKKFFQESMDETKNWVLNIEDFIEKALPDGNCIYRNTMPIISILPSNSEQEFLYVVAQGLLSKNAMIIRPSSKGAGAYTGMQFAQAFYKALDKVGRGNLLPLKEAISILNTENEGFLERMSIPEWNYIMFGEDNTILNLTERINENIPKGTKLGKVLGFGTGLSTTIIYKSESWKKNISDIAESIIINCGNECVSTDIIYVEKSEIEDFERRLKQELQKYYSGNPFNPEKNGYVSKNNIEWIKAETAAREKEEYLQLEKIRNHEILHPSIIPINENQTTVEYPGPVVSIRTFNNEDELISYTIKDRRDNGNKSKNLVSSVYCDHKEQFLNSFRFLKAYTIRHNQPTHKIDLTERHQGVYITREFVDRVDVFK